MPPLPSGTVTFLFSDVEGSTRLLQEVGSERYGSLLRIHRERVREALRAHHGVELGTEGDSFFVAFMRAADALAAAEQVQSALADGPIRVRIGIHTGEPLIVDDDYVGIDVHKAARICAAAHGGQILVSQATRDLSGVDLEDLGEHRLKDLSAPERLFQARLGTFPPLRTLTRSNLPVQPTPSFGREQELADLGELLNRHRLITLTGPGGSGKTRLALQLAAEKSDVFRDGVWWVPLTPVRDPGLILPTISQTMGAGRDLLEHLHGKHLLLLLDNFEQVLDGSSAVAELVMALPHLSVVVTSRERLAISFEQEYPVPPLGDGPAKELFASRARQLKPDFQPDQAVGDICARLDNLPLALELASTRVKVLTTRQILGRLERRLDLLTRGARDAPPRQATMRAAIAWSHDLLVEKEQVLFRRLAVFVDTFELEAAEEVCDADLDVLQSLVDKSLLRQGQNGRFFLLETTREFALDQLEASGEADAIRRRHANRFLRLVRVADGRLRSADQAEWLARIRADNGNLRAVLAWSLEHDVPRGVELASTLFRAWMMQGQLDELIAWLDRALPLTGTAHPAIRADALVTLGTALFMTNELKRGEEVLTESLGLFRAMDDPRGEARVLNELGGVLWSQGIHDGAIELREQALQIYREHGDLSGVARSLHLIGEDLRDSGDFERGGELLEEAMRIDTELGDVYSVATSAHSLADLALDKGDLLDADRRFRSALRTVSALGDERGQAYCLAGLASARGLADDRRVAGLLWEVAESLETKLGQPFLNIERQRYERILMPLYNDPEFQAGRREAQQLTLAEVVAQVFSDHVRVTE